MKSGKRSHSSGLDVPARFKLYEWCSLLGHCLRGSYSVGGLFDDFDGYDRYLATYARKNLRDSKVFEIGFGARPFRMISLMSMGIDVTGIDMDQPVLHGAFREFREIYRRNGFERFLKSVVRNLLFDRKVRREVKRELARRGHEVSISRDRFIIGDVGEFDMEEHSVDFLFSEDTFEHIPRVTLETLVPRMRRWLKKDGLAAIDICVYTGITGGHLIGWYIYDVLKDRTGKKSEPWEHLRKKRHVANTYLNQLHLAEYRKLFLQHFDILEEKNRYPGMGRKYLSPEIRKELKDFSEEDLLSNQILFVLRPK